MMDALDRAIANTQAHLHALRSASGHWEGHLSSSALSTATAIVALALVDPEKHAVHTAAGARWLCEHQNADGGWGDTTLSKSNLSTTLLCWSALHLVAQPSSPTVESANGWITAQVGSLAPATIARAVVSRYGKDKTFSFEVCNGFTNQRLAFLSGAPLQLLLLPHARALPGCPS